LSQALGPQTAAIIARVANGPLGHAVRKMAAGSGAGVAAAAATGGNQF